MSYSTLPYLSQLFFKTRPIHLTFFLTRRCNAKCSFCFYLSDEEEPEPPQDELSLEEIEHLSGSLGNLLWLAFSGGEIYLRKDLVEIARIFYGQNQPAIMLFPTNGLAPDIIYEKTRSILEQCPKSVVVVKLSLDGLEQLHDSIRNVEGAFEKCLETYEKLKPLLKKYSNFELGINSVYCAANQHNIQDLQEFVSSMADIRTHSISLIRGEAAKDEADQIDIEKYLAVSDNMATSFRHRKQPMYKFSGGQLKAAVDVLQRSLIYRTIKEKKRLIPCFAGQLNLVLTETGDVFPCEAFSRKMGNIRNFDHDFTQLLKNTMAKQVQREIKQNACYCTHECYFLTNILFNPQQYPRLLKEVLIRQFSKT